MYVTFRNNAFYVVSLARQSIPCSCLSGKPLKAQKNAATLWAKNRVTRRILKRVSQLIDALSASLQLWIFEDDV